MRKLGPASARKLRTRLDDLAAAPCLEIAFSLPGRFHPLTGDRAGQYAISLHDGCRLVLEPADNPGPRLPDGSLDLKQVSAVRVVFIGDYHD